MNRPGILFLVGLLFLIPRALPAQSSPPTLGSLPVHIKGTTAIPIPKPQSADSTSPHPALPLPVIPCDLSQTIDSNRARLFIQLLTSIDGNSAYYRTLKLEMNEYDPEEARRYLDDLGGIWFPHYYDSSKKPEEIIKRLRNPILQWGAYWNPIKASIDLPVLLDLFMSKDLDIAGDLRQAYSNAWCFHDTGTHFVFRGTLARDQRRVARARCLGICITDTYWTGVPYQLEMLSGPDFPFGRLLVKPGHEHEALQQANDLWFHPPNGAPRESAYPNITRWDVEVAPIINRIPARVFESSSDYHRYVTSKGKLGGFTDTHVFELYLAGRVHKQTYLDNRLESQLGQNRGVGGHGFQGRVLFQRTIVLPQNDSYTQHVIASLFGDEFARGIGPASISLTPSHIFEISDHVRYDSEEFRSRVTQACEWRNNQNSCIDSNVIPDSLSHSSTRLCPVGHHYLSAEEAGATVPANAVLSEDRSGYCVPISDAAKVPTYLEGQRGGIRVQGRNERIECLRTGNNCPVTNAPTRRSTGSRSQ